MNARNKKTILLTAFEAFGSFTSNPTLLLAEKLEGVVLGEYAVKTLVLPVEFGTAPQRLAEQIEKLAPAVVVCLGQAAGRSGITPERIAVNLDDADIPDNAGYQPVEQSIIRDGPVAYWSTLPVAKIVEAISALDIPANISMSAGTYVCNHVFYSLMHLLSGMPEVKGGFIHVPLMSGQADDGRPVLAIEEMEQGVRCALNMIVQDLDDDRK